MADLSGTIVYARIIRDGDGGVEVHVEVDGLITRLWMTDAEAEEVIRGNGVDVTFTDEPSEAKA